MPADLAEAIGHARTFSDALRRLRPRRTGHDPGRITVDLAVMLADGSEAIADLALLGNQPDILWPIASTPTTWLQADETRDGDLVVRTRFNNGREDQIQVCPRRFAFTRQTRVLRWPIK
ncbi:hypothetical protein [Streptomyces sp. NPDC097640]|uniref:hypothetical protein n=1 Tax=Streptomyces sp. NPDC097640 TaxID=3157229 RepID=UPI00331893A2